MNTDFINQIEDMNKKQLALFTSIHREIILNTVWFKQYETEKWRAGENV